MTEHLIKILQRTIKSGSQTSILWLLIIIIGFSAYYWSSISLVPFHPDEATQIYMSADIQRFFINPFDLAWQADQKPDAVMRYRLLDAPLTRDLIGISLAVQGLQPIPVDWDWTKTWNLNEQAGALPSAQILNISRWAVAVFFPFTLFFGFLTFQKFGGKLSGWVGFFLLVSNALVWLHTRRAMAESVLLFTAFVSVWSLLKARQRVYLTAIPLAFAINSKQSLLPFALVGLILCFFPPADEKKRVRWVLKQSVLFLFLLSGISLLLNPFLWKDPFHALMAAINERTIFSNQQIAAFSYFNKLILPQNGIDVLSNLIIQLFFTTPAVADVGNYIAQTQAATQIYFTNNLMNLFRDLVGGSIFLGLTILGIVFSIIKIKQADLDLCRRMLILNFAGLFVLIFQLLWVPLPFQRYVFPLLPFVFTWQAIALNDLVKIVFNQIKQSQD
jgi:hypothetical protein